MDICQTKFNKYCRIFHTLVSFTIEADSGDIIEISLKIVLNTTLIVIVIIIVIVSNTTLIVIVIVLNTTLIVIVIISHCVKHYTCSHSDLAQIHKY
jgi:Flp pilus assembly protein TadB